MSVISKIRNTSIQNKITGIAVIVGMVAVMLAFGIFLAFDYFNFREQTITRVSAQAQAIGTQSVVSLGIGAKSPTKQALYRVLMPNQHVTYAAIFDRKNRLFVDYDRDLVTDSMKQNINLISQILARRPAMLKSNYTPDFKENETTFDLADNKLEVYLPIRQDNEKVATIYIKSDLEAFYARYKRFSVIVFGIFFITTSIAFIVSRNLQKIISKPILDLAETTNEVSIAKDFSIRVTGVERKDEIGTLATGFNEMLAQIELQNEALVQAKEDAEESARVKEQFLANMSHEIRTPMNGVKGMADLLIDSPISDTQKKWVNIIKTSADNLLVIINDILDFSKIESGKLQLTDGVIHLQQVLDTMVTNLEPKWKQEKGLVVAQKIDDNVPPSFIADPVRFNQILLNLFSNAIKFTYRGSIVIGGEVLDETDDKMKLRFWVKDTGIGIPREKFEDIFTVFTQATGDTTRKFGGTGLGLSISKQLVEMQGGRMSLESELDKGSTFAFEMWFKKNQTHTLPASEELNQGTQKVPELTMRPRVLLAEDNDVNQLLVQTLLGQWNFDVDVAENGQKAVDMLQATHYSLVLMDVHMPELDGYEATRAIRQLEGSKSKIPIIAMTASALKGEAEKCIAAGMDDYISKPFNKNMLYEKMVKLISA